MGDLVLVMSLLSRDGRLHGSGARVDDDMTNLAFHSNATNRGNTHRVRSLGLSSSPWVSRGMRPVVCTHSPRGKWLLRMG